LSAEEFAFTVQGDNIIVCPVYSETILVYNTVTHATTEMQFPFSLWCNYLIAINDVLWIAQEIGNVSLVRYNMTSQKLLFVEEIQGMVNFMLPMNNSVCIF
jgi:hypothetical protein